MMRTKLASVGILALLAVACSEHVADPTSASFEGIALLSVQPSPGPASLARSRPAGCPWCTAAFAAEVEVGSSRTLTGVNLWLDGWAGSRRCLTSQHDSPADGFTLAAARPTTVGFHQAAVDCEAPFTVDRLEVRMRSGDTLVYEGSWPVSLRFEE